MNKNIKRILIISLFFCAAAAAQITGLNCVVEKGGITRFDKTKKEIRLVFTGHHFADGGALINETLKKNGIKASFFLTGDFYRNPDFARIIIELRKAGNYLGSHSDRHILYVDRGNPDSVIITKEEFLCDLENSYKELASFGVTRQDAPFFLPPFELYNSRIAEWVKEAGFTLVNYTPGTLSNQDYSVPEMGSGYINSRKIFENIIEYEKNSYCGLNGFILLMHIGTEPGRTDKFYYKLDSLIAGLKEKGYIFKTINEN